MCQHFDRPNVLSLPSMGNPTPPHMCRECWDEKMGKVQTSGKVLNDWESHRDPYKHSGWIGLGYGSWSGSFDK